MTKRKRRRRRPVETTTYYCEIKAWHVTYWNSGEVTVDNGRFVRGEADHHLDLQLDVELLEPVKEVKRGTLRLGSPTKVSPDSRGEESLERLEYGGVIWYRKENGEQVMGGFLRSNNSGNLALITLLSAGKKVILDLYGNLFYRREAVIRHLGWYTAGHPDLEDELADAHLMNTRHPAGREA